MPTSARHPILRHGSTLLLHACQRSSNRLWQAAAGEISRFPCSLLVMSDDAAEIRRAERQALRKALGLPPPQSFCLEGRLSADEVIDALPASRERDPEPAAADVEALRKLALFAGASLLASGDLLLSAEAQARLSRGLAEVGLLGDVLELIARPIEHYLD